MTTLLALALILAQAPDPSELRNVRIRVRSTWTVDEHSVAVGVGVRVPPPRVAVAGSAGSSASKRETVQEVLALSGGSAELRVARETPVAPWLQQWSAGHGLQAPGGTWQEVGTSLAVEPLVLADGRISLRLTPRISGRANGSPFEVDVVELSTEVVVRPGQELDLGGLPMSDESFRERFFLGFADGGRVSRVKLVVSAEAS
jgi:hypothetical protein